ncbi:Organic solvent tolerance protein [Moraxella caprae]|uniref:Organic solvent tolerance protein n=1 Tax=Moraxella caprae TaxID=90240 RepID=A0A378U4N3_9GAMM|nr:LptA/OstA family protein [Moraxella caprae]STZ70265.1 Organic solvent tolerance protein [Moraxella caprae]
MTRGQATQNKQDRQKQDFFGKKHELTICVGMALFGVLPTLSHAQSFVTSDDITRPSSNSTMSHTPMPATVQTVAGAKVEAKTDDGLGFITNNDTQTANSVPTITQPRLAHLSHHAITSHSSQYSPEYRTQDNPQLDDNPYLNDKLTGSDKQGNTSDHSPNPTSFVTSDIHDSQGGQGKQNTTFISSENISQDHHANTQKSQSLAKLAQYYHAKPNTGGHVARCEGVWVQPKRESLSQTLGYRGHGDDNETFYAQADYGYYDNKDYAELAGNVIIEQNGQQIVADKLIYQPSTGQMRATGQVLFSDDRPPSTGGSKVSGAGIIGVADNLYYADDGRTATAHDVAFASTTMNAHGHAHTLNKVGDNQYHMQDVMFSTCPPTERKWHLDASSIDIDNDTGRGVAKNSTLRIGNVPVFYLPYFNFPIDDRRASGFLLPTAGFGSDSFEISTPYYLNLAPNYDATITPTVFSNKNPMLTANFATDTACRGRRVAWLLFAQ